MKYYQKLIFLIIILIVLITIGIYSYTNYNNKKMTKGNDLTAEHCIDNLCISNIQTTFDENNGNLYTISGTVYSKIKTKKKCVKIILKAKNTSKDAQYCFYNLLPKSYYSFNTIVLVDKKYNFYNYELQYLTKEEIKQLEPPM